MSTKKDYAGVLFAVLSAVCWSFSGVLGKAVSWNSFSIMGFRAAIATVLLGMARGGFRVRPTRGTLLGALAVTATSLLYLCALRLTTAANAIVLQYAMPAFVILLCWIFYHQRPSLADLITTAFVLLGVTLCSIQGMKSGAFLGDFLAILSAISFAAVFFCARMPGTRPEDYSYLGNMLSSVLLFSLLFDTNIGKEPMDWLYMLLMGLAQTGGYYFFARATSRIPPLTAALTSNIEPVLNPIWVFLFLGEKPGWLTFVGAAIVLSTVTIYSMRGSARQ